MLGRYKRNVPYCIYHQWNCEANWPQKILYRCITNQKEVHKVKLHSSIIHNMVPGDKEVNTFLLVSSFKQNKVFIDSESFSLIENIEHRRNHFHFRYWWIAVYWNYCYIQIPFCVWIYLQRSLYWYHWKHRQLLETYKVERDKISPLRAFDWLHHT